MEEIYNEYFEIIYKYLISLTQNKEIAEELTQETFYRAVKNIKKFKKDSTIKTWLFKIAKNLWIDYYKKSKKCKEVTLDDYNEIILSNNSFEEELFNRNDLMRTYKKIHELDEISKEVVYLRLGTNFSFKEIGEIFLKTEGWAKIIFYRAKIKLKEDLKNGQ